ncbi:MAG: transporter substrate-binding domain-containing protein, partial [Prevotella sp.]|nr:transporter substrate-binding domain-containing protein [Prevotella sp.]
MKKLMAMLLALVMVMSLAACGEQKTNDNKGDAAPDDANTPAEITYAVEAGSAGEEVAQANGFKTVSVGSQANALMEVDAGTADAAIIDLLMAGAMVGEGTSYPDLKVTDQKLNSELYGVGCRKGSDLTSFINSVMSAAYADGTMVELAKTY